MSARPDLDLVPEEPARIVPVVRGRDRRRHRDLIRAVYGDGPGPHPATLRTLDDLLRGRSLLAARAQWRAWLALEADRPVAALVALLHSRYADTTGQAIGTIGFLEALPGRERAVDDLFGAAERWLASRGAVEIRGPVNGLPQYGAGCLETRSDEAPAGPVAQNPFGYAALWWRLRYRPARSRYAYRIDLAADSTRSAIARTVMQVPGVTLRAASGAQWRREIDGYADLRGESDDGDPGFVPIGRDEAWEVLGSWTRPADAELTGFAEAGGHGIGFALAAYDRARVPSGLWARISAPSRAARAVLWDVGVAEPHRRRGIGSALVAQSLAAMERHGVREVIVHPIRDDDDPMRRLLRRFGAQPTRTYLSFTKTLS